MKGAFKHNAATRDGAENGCGPEALKHSTDVCNAWASVKFLK